MSDTENTTTGAPEAEVEEPKSEGAGLRAQLEAALAENKRLKEKDQRDAFTAAGFDPDKELGKAMWKEYEGEATPEAVRAYAQTEYGWQPPNPAIDTSQQITTEQGRLDAAAVTAGSIAPQLPDAQALAKAEAEGDWTTAGAIKAKILEARLG